MSQRNKSYVWKHFVKDEESKKIVCQHCSVKLTDCKNTSNLQNHLISQHGLKPPVKRSVTVSADEELVEIIDEELDVVAVVDGSLASDLNASTSGTSATIPTQKEITTYFEKTTVAEPRLKQPKISTTMNNQKLFEAGAAKHSKITEAILFMITKDNCPLSTCEDEGFLNLMKTTVPLYKVPSRNTVTALVDDRFEHFHGKAKKMLEKQKAVTLTTDIWTDTLNSISYLGLTVHFEENFQMKSLNTGMIVMEEAHYTVYIKVKLLEICAKWGINPDNVNGVVSDNAANITKACKETFDKAAHLGCFAHSLNLVVTLSIEKSPELSECCKKVRKIVTFFKKSNNAADMLRQRQNDSPLKLIQDVPTRWNSTFYMIQRFILLLDSVNECLFKLKEAPDMVDRNEIQMLKEALLLLEPFEKLTSEMSGQKYVTISKVIPSTSCIRKHLVAVSSEIHRRESLDLFMNLDNEMSKRFTRTEDIEVYIIATLLDPRFKKLYFEKITNVARGNLKIVELLKVLIRAESDSEKESATNEENNPDVVNVPKNSFWGIHETMIKDTASSDGPAITPQAILNSYFAEKHQPMEMDPFLFWKRKALESNEFKMLAKIALKYLSIVATSVPSEQSFSLAGNIITTKRNRLNPERASKLMFLKSLEAKDWGFM